MDTTDSMPSRLLTTHNGNGFAVAGGFLSWLRHPQRGLPYLIFLSLAVLVALTFAIHWTVSNVGGEERPQASLIHGHRSERNSRFGSAKASELKMQIDELRSIRSSVSNELLELEKKRQTLLSEISGYTTAIDGLKQSYQTTSDELNRLKVSFANLQVEQNELLKNNLPNIVAPRQILPQSKARDISAFTITTQRTDCRLHNCFDYSRCSVTSLFPVYVYPFDELGISDNANKFIRESVKQAFDTSVYVTDNPDNACIFVVVVNYVVNNESVIRQLLHQLPYWHGHGLNHVLVNLVRPPSYSLLQNTLHSIDVGAAMVAQSFFTERGFRDHFDLVLPAALGPANGDIWDQLPMLVPARRRYLLSFVGEVNMERSTSSAINNTQLHQFNFYSSYDSIIVNILKKLQTEYISDVFFFEFICKNDKMPSMNNEWVLCGSDIERAELFQQSTFSLIIAPADESLVSTPVLQIWLSELLKSGVVPVILGDYVHLPFSDVVSWSKAVVRLPKARITELHFVLRSFTDSDILEMRQHGRLIYETFLGTTKSIVDTILATIRHRLRIPAFPITDEPSPSVFNESFIPLQETVMESVIEADEMLGPVEPPLASPRYSRNFTFTNDKFLLPGDPFHSYPYTPFEPLMPADAKFVGSSYGFRPIGQGVGGAGKEFSEALGGNVAREQFTVVVLTYEREAVLINAISRLKGLPHINKVVVVWNSPLPPAEDLRWPDIGVKIHVVRTTKNSLNNRFLPYDVIETEAVLSVDDDAHLRHDEIMFGFRVWREARDRIVGFPGRFNSWDVQHQNWLYNSNYSCELSMVLTGAAFIHKYYLYLYSYVMPQAIRDKVDEYINCEDLAMNFLVAHVTRKPPIKVTSRWTFRCPGCPKALSVEESHFNERHKCVNFFVRVYGYMPLLNTQFRADSMLFKTRIPHDKQKCFKFI